MKYNTLLKEMKLRLSGKHQILIASVKLISLLNQPSKKMENAFYQCKLLSLRLPQYIRTIKTKAFDTCCLENEVELPESLEEVHEWAFSTNFFKSLHIPRNLRYIGLGAFHYNTKIEEITVDLQNNYFTTTPKARGLFDKSITTLILVPVNLESYEIPKTVITIAGRAFPLISFNTLIIPANVRFIENWIITSQKNFETLIIHGNPKFQGYIFRTQYEQGIKIIYHGKKAVDFNILNNTPSNGVTVCDGYEGDTFGGLDKTIDKNCPAYPYKFSCPIRTKVLPHLYTLLLFLFI